MSITKQANQYLIATDIFCVREKTLTWIFHLIPLRDFTDVKNLFGALQNAPSVLHQVNICEKQKPDP